MSNGREDIAKRKKQALKRRKKRRYTKAQKEQLRIASEELVKQISSQYGYDQLLRTLFRKSFYEFFKFFWHTVVPDDFVDNFHIKEVCDALQEVGLRACNLTREDGKKKRLHKIHDLLVNIPPGESKSTICSVLFPVWLWIIDPSIKIICASNDGALSRRLAELSKGCIESPAFKRLYPHILLTKDAKAKTFYRNIFGGFRLSTSTRSNIIGNHAHIHILDDPNSSDPGKVDNEEELKRVNKWITRTLSTRKTNKKITPTIMVMQRLAVNDAAGNMLANAGNRDINRVKQLCIPAEDKYEVIPERLREKYTDGVMNPHRSGKEELLQELKNLGGRAYDAQHGMSPTQLEGAIIKRSWIRVLKRYQVPQEVFKLVPDFVVDTAYKEGEENDPSAILSYVYYNGILYILHYSHAKLSIGKLLRFLYQQTVAQGRASSRIWVEPKASGVSVVQAMKNPTIRKAFDFARTLNIKEWQMADGDKIARLQSVSPYFEFERVVILDEPWTHDYVERLVGFPTVDIKEPADLTSMACINAFNRKLYQGYDFN